MKKFILFCICCIMYAQMQGQEVFQAEYFFDSDPGVGNGITMPLSVNGTISGNETLDIAALSPGFHTWYVRAKQNGAWGHYGVKRTFYISTIDLGAQTGVIQAAEYFIDTDPGVGEGVGIPITSGSEVAANVMIDISGIASGFHTLYVRTRQDGAWGHYSTKRTFYINTVNIGTQTGTVQAAEYFFDEDPGVGNGVDIPITAGSTVSGNVLMDISDLDPGFHAMYVRTKQDDAWGHYGIKRVFYINIQAQLAQTPINRVEGFFNNDPGVGNGVVVDITPGVDLNTSVSIPVGDLAEGVHTLYFRVLDENNAVSHYVTNEFLVCTYADVYPAFTTEILESCANGTFSVEVTLSANWSGPIFSVVNNLTAQTDTFAPGETYVYGPFSSEAEVEFLADNNFTDEICPLLIPVTYQCFDCPALLADNGDPCTADGQSGTLVDCECLLPDCNDVLGGTAYEDDCGVCDIDPVNDNETCADCAGVPNGNSETDACGFCYENGTSNPEWNSTCADCAGVPNGPNQLDECNVCINGGESNPNWNTSCVDCEGTPNGTAFLDDCNVCVGGNTGIEACVQDCNGDFGGTAFTDECGTCVGGNTGETACTEDCNGVFGGTAFTDNCGICVGGTTGEEPCEVDCAGVPGGSSMEDDCGVCRLPDDPDYNSTCLDCAGVTNGNSETDLCGECLEGGPSNPDWNTFCADCAGVPNGPNQLDACNVCINGGESNPNWNTSCADCEGTPNGTAFLDDCEVCVGGNTGIEACVQDCNGDFGGTAFTDECGTCVGGNTGETACTEDCNGVFGGTAFTDNCGTCVGGTTGIMPCETDCNGVPGGSAFLDNCAVCVGGNTGITACVQDCNGDFGGIAFTDECGTCVGGNTGETACIEDCNGDFGGNAQPGTTCMTSAGQDGFWSENCLCVAEAQPCGIEITAISDSGDPCGDGIPNITLGLAVDNVPSGSTLNLEIIYDDGIGGFESDFLEFPVPDGAEIFAVEFDLIGYGLTFEIVASIGEGDLACSASVSESYPIPVCIPDCEGVFGGNANPGTPCTNESAQTGIWSEECICEVETGTCLADAGAIFTNSSTTVCENSLDLVKVRFSDLPNMDYKSIGLITDNSPDPLVLAYFFAQPADGFSFNEYAGNQFQIWVLNVEFPDQILSEAAQSINNGIYPPLSTIDGLCFDLSNPIAVTKTDCNPSGENCFASSVVDYVEGSSFNGGFIADDRTNPNNALGAPEQTDQLVFVSLGYGGSITLSFDPLVPNGEGNDLMVVETTFNSVGCNVYPEYADVYVSQNGVDFHFAKTVCKSDNLVDISDAGQGFTFITSVRIVNNDALSTTPDGYDLDGVATLHHCLSATASVSQNSPEMGFQTKSTLSNNPNPSNGLSTVQFNTGTSGRTLLELFDMSGRSVTTLFNQDAEAGQNYRFNFDGTFLPNGVYIYRLTTENEVVIDKMLIAR